MKQIDVPIIEFRNSWIYSQQWSRPDHLKEPPSKEDWTKRERKLIRLWDRHGLAVLQTMSKVTGLSWQEDRIIAYLTWGVKPFSDPLTMSLRPDVESVFDTLTHELIHRLCSQPKNWKRIQKRWTAFVKKYLKEELLVVHHVPIHAVHELIWNKLFPQRVKIIKTNLQLKPYVRAWELVDEIGAEMVVKKVFTLGT